MNLEIDDLSRSEVQALLSEHLRDMRATSPACSVHALDLEKLRQPAITVWTAWDGGLLLGCGALKELDRTHGEVTSMRTPTGLRGRGAGRAILDRIVGVARARGYERLSLERGADTAFAPAHALYLSAGFGLCDPFGDYLEDRNSVFMTLRL
ncbi:MAG: family acetyltransferase [Frankiales bacterium]|nr:family acetyltransferase [Frankiales bacterium]